MVSHDPSTDDFYVVILSNANHSPVSISSFRDIALAGFYFQFGPSTPQADVVSFADFAFYKEIVTSLPDLFSLSQTGKLLAYYSMRDKYLADELGQQAN